MNDAQKVDIYFQLCSTLNFQFVQYVNDHSSCADPSMDGSPARGDLKANQRPQTGEVIMITHRQQ